MTRDCFSSAEGFDYNFPRVLAPGKREPEMEECNTSPLNQIRVLDWRSIRSRGGFSCCYSRFPPGAACWRRCAPSDFCPRLAPLTPDSSPLGNQTHPQKNSCTSGALVSFSSLPIHGVARADLQGPTRRLFVKLLFISFIKSSSCPPKSPELLPLTHTSLRCILL